MIDHQAAGRRLLQWAVLPALLGLLWHATWQRLGAAPPTPPKAYPAACVED